MLNKQETAKFYLKQENKETNYRFILHEKRGMCGKGYIRKFTENKSAM